tara:strand:- start:9231 stop:9725 length:495 start_codon:yes stop_codon:yes gene_type:complete
MAKKTRKVKKNSVKSTTRSTTKKKSRPKAQQKKKTVKKKAVKKKKKTVAKTAQSVKKRKVVSRKTTKKKIRRRKSRKISMEDIYKILNKVQIGEERLSFAVEFAEADVVENIVKDVGVAYNRIEMKTQTLFNLEPSKESPKYHIEIEDYFDDELPDEDEINFDF